MNVHDLYHLCSAEGTEDEAIDLVYDSLSALLEEKNFSACDEVVRSLDEKKLTPAVIASVLTITAGAKSVLAERDGFCKRALLHLNKIRGATATERLLDGLAYVASTVHFTR